MAHRLEEWEQKGNRVLAIMDDWLKTHAYFAGAEFSVADIALYAYTHVAEEADYDLARYPAIRDWLARVAARPRHVGLDWRP